MSAYVTEVYIPYDGALPTGGTDALRRRRRRRPSQAHLLVLLHQLLGTGREFLHAPLLPRHLSLEILPPSEKQHGSQSSRASVSPEITPPLGKLEHNLSESTKMGTSGKVVFAAIHRCIPVE